MMNKALYEYVLRLGDDSLILGQRLAEWCGHGPILEEDIAMTNISLDLIGQATSLLEYAANLKKDGTSADDLAFLRFDKEFKNLLLVEQPNENFGVTMLRQFFFDAYRIQLWTSLIDSSDEQLSAIAEKSLKETKYHLKHSSEWVIRLGDGTDESREKIQDALNSLWRYTAEIFYVDHIDDELLSSHIIPTAISKDAWMEKVNSVLSEATLEIPQNKWEFQGGRVGKHSEHLGYILAEMQYMQRAYPGMQW